MNAARLALRRLLTEIPPESYSGPVKELPRAPNSKRCQRDDRRLYHHIGATPTSSCSRSLRSTATCAS